MAQTASDLAAKKCQACEGGVAPLTEAEAAKLLKRLDGWELSGGRIAKTYTFKDYYQATAFCLDLAPRGPSPGYRARLQSVPGRIRNACHQRPQ